MAADSCRGSPRESRCNMWRKLSCEDAVGALDVLDVLDVDGGNSKSWTTLSNAAVKSTNISDIDSCLLLQNDVS
eukprot:3461688-Amphidinium_carterae.3